MNTNIAVSFLIVAIVSVSSLRCARDDGTTTKADGSGTETRNVVSDDARQKLDSHLWSAIEQARTGKSAGSAAPEAEVDVENGRILVDIDGAASEALSRQIVQLGGEIVSSVPAYHSTRAWMPVLGLEALAGRTDVRFISPAARGTSNAPPN